MPPCGSPTREHRAHLVVRHGREVEVVLPDGLELRVDDEAHEAIGGALEFSRGLRGGAGHRHGNVARPVSARVREGDAHREASGEAVVHQHTPGPGRWAPRDRAPYAAIRRWISPRTRAFACSTSAGESPSIATDSALTYASPSSSSAPKANSGATAAVSLPA